MTKQDKLRTKELDLIIKCTADPTADYSIKIIRNRGMAPSTVLIKDKNQDTITIIQRTYSNVSLTYLRLDSDEIISLLTE
jgi:predicted metal-dependent TIM-barrel fold hydrolase